ncbi:MAG: hypothetical protein K0R09_1553 [Clostridiales bacterium]|jgi:hypothetical protein|nr:hypothetical protein [Clostridiales bacterium]
MVYLLLGIGLVLIYFSQKSSKATDRKKNFRRVLQSQIDSKDIMSAMDELKELSDRVANIETSLLLIDDKLCYNNVDVSNKVENRTQSSEENTEEQKPVEIIEQVVETITLNDTLYQLYDEGKTVDEISSITRIGKGEILLRIGLRKQ